VTKASCAAALFDLDGTLVDTEDQTDEAIEQVMARHGHRGVRLPPVETRGRSWEDIATALKARHDPTLEARRLIAELEQVWAEATSNAKPIPGAAEAVRQAAQAMRVAVVSSSPRVLVSRLLGQLGVSDVVSDEARIGSDSVRRHKPDPEGFLLAATRLGVPATQCTVFEDSRSGLLAARAAGMPSLLVLHRCAEPELCRPLATGAFPHYLALPAGFWSRLAESGAAAL
jgi:HAD superfamily hydrolase (TIGR01509 family)